MPLQAPDGLNLWNGRWVTVQPFYNSADLSLLSLDFEESESKFRACEGGWCSSARDTDCTSARDDEDGMGMMIRMIFNDDDDDEE